MSKQKTDLMKAQTQNDQREPVSMHENIPVWYDCCSCEAEPYWVEAFAEADNSDEQASTGQNQGGRA